MAFPTYRIKDDPAGAEDALLAWGRRGRRKGELCGQPPRPPVASLVALAGRVSGLAAGLPHARDK